MKTVSLVKNFLVNKVPFWVYIAVISSVYLVLSSGNFSQLIPEAGHDDGLQLHVSESLSKGHWLGRYNNLTLAKGLTYPTWTAVAHTADIQLWAANAGLMILACLAVLFATRTVVKGKVVRILLYTLLLFDPLITSRAYRDSIAPALILLLLAWLLGVFLTATEQKGDPRTVKRSMMLYTAVGIVALPMWWYLREDYFWVLPFTVVALGITLGISLHKYIKRGRDKRALSMTILAVVLPFFMTFALGLGIAAVNQHVYGRFVVNDYMSQDFLEAYGSLTRIKNDNWQITVPVSRSMREKAYTVSPAFAELRSCLDDNGKGACEGFIMNMRAKGDYEGGWFFWALRQAVQGKGYYENATKAEQYYVRLAKEINSACDSGKIACSSPKRASLSAPFDSRIIGPVLDDTYMAVGYVIALKDADTIRTTSFDVYSPSKEEMAEYLGTRYNSDESNVGVQVKNKLVRWSARAYQLFNPWLFLGSIIALGWVTVFLKKFKVYWREILIAWGLVMLMVVRIVMIAYVNATAFPAIGAMYFSSFYPVMFLLEGLIIGLVARIYFSKDTKQYKSKQSKQSK